MTNKTYLQSLINEEKENGTIPVRETFKRDGKLVDTTLERLQDIYVSEIVVDIIKKCLNGKLKKNEEHNNYDFISSFDFSRLSEQETNLFLNYFKFTIEECKKEVVQEEPSEESSAEK